jgi:hypothetical protein
MPNARYGVGHVEKKLISDRHLQEIKKLPDLSLLSVKVELPIEKKKCRDLFLFEEQNIMAIKSSISAPVILTKIQLENERLILLRNQEINSWPSSLVYLGYLGTKSSGKIGAFSRNEEPVTIKQGGLFSSRWRLVMLIDTAAKFQNLKFPDIWQNIEAVESKDDSYDSAQDNNF